MYKFIFNNINDSYLIFSIKESIFIRGEQIMKDTMVNQNESCVKSNQLERMSNCNKTREMDNLCSKNNHQNIKQTEQKTQISSQVIRPKMLLQSRIQERIRQELQKKKLQMNQQKNQMQQKQSPLIDEIQQNENEKDDRSLQTIQNLIGQIIKKKNETAKQFIQEEPSQIINIQHPKLSTQYQHSPEVDQMMEQIVNDIPESQLENIFEKIDNQNDNIEDNARHTKKINQNIVEIQDDQSLVSRNQNEMTIAIEEANYNLKVASAIKSFLPNYPLQNIICCLQKQINKIQMVQTAKRIIERNQTLNHYSSYEEPINMAKKMYTQKNNFPVTRNPYGPSAPSPRMKLRQYQQQYSPSPFSETNHLFPVPQKHQNRKNSQAYRQSVTKNNSFQRNMSSQKPAPVQNLKNNERQSLERQIAHVFVTKGYGLTLTKQYTKQQIQGNRYNSLLTSVIRSGLRKLCEIMNKNLKQDVKSYDSAEQRLLRSSLVNCRKWLSRNEQQTFYKIINIAYGMSQQPIYEEEVTALYERIKKELDRRIVQEKGKKIKTDVSQNGAKKVSNTSVSHNIPSQFNPSQTSNNNFFSPPQMTQRQNSVNQRMVKMNQTFVQSKNQSFQNSSHIPPSINILQNNVEPPKNQAGSNLIKYEREIVGQYSHNKNVDQVFQYLTKKYRDIEWNKEELSKTIQKLIKIGLKKILKFRKEFVPQSPNLPPLNLNENIVSGIIHAPAALQTRVTVVKSLLENNLTLLRTVQLINVVNNCIQQLNVTGRKV